ncbi:MAG: glycerol acyltransferase [Chloroflexi bacterium]|nr:glycerol acyltransferase [Chloroflexota bacterium]
MNLLDALTQINLDDLVVSFGWQDHRILSAALRRISSPAAKKFAGQMLDFDNAVGARGLADAARLSLRRYVRGVRIFDADRIPASAFLALSNHPGLTDTLALCAALNRADLKIIALNRPFLLSLSNISRQLLYVTDNPHEQINLVRRVSGHLRAGGAALTFPAGHIEPDPDVYPGAIDSLKGWTDSAGIFIRLAPETAIVPILVRGVIWDKTAHHPIVKLKKIKEEREKLAAALQLLAMVVFNARPVTVTVQIGNPITVKELGTNDTQVIHQAVLKEMKQLIENPPEGKDESAL